MHIKMVGLNKRKKTSIWLHFRILTVKASAETWMWGVGEWVDGWRGRREKEMFQAP